MQASNVVFGEASESDSEDDACQANTQVISEPKKQSHLGGNRQVTGGSLTGVEPVMKIKHDECPSLLHQTLRSKNRQLRSCLIHIYCHPYESANKDIDAISQKLIASQRIIQTVDTSLRKIKRELDQIELVSWPAMMSPRWSINDE